MGETLQEQVLRIAHEAAPFAGIALNGAYPVEERLACANKALDLWEALIEEVEE